MNGIQLEQRVRHMSRPERADYLRAAGWQRISYTGAQAWRAPNASDRSVYSLAAAIRTAMRVPVR